MAGGLRKRIVSASGVLLGVGLLTSGALIPVAANAQRGPQPPPVAMGNLAHRDVGVGEHVPNISGVWLSQSSNRTIQPIDGRPTPFLPWAKEFFETRGAAERSGQPLFDPSANCLPGGVPRIIASPYPIDIIQTPELTLITTETLHQVRQIHMDAMPRPADYKPSYMGYSVGHWEGEVLVVETDGFNGYTQVDEEGRPKSSDMKVVERYVKRSPNLLEVTFTMYDPRTYSEPWSSRAQFRWAPELKLNEYICEENNRNKPDASGKLRHGTQ